MTLVWRITITKETLLAQVERAEEIAAHTPDSEVKRTLLDAARDYRLGAKTETWTLDPDWRLPREIS
jgi:hypothetical protein